MKLLSRLTKFYKEEENNTVWQGPSGDYVVADSVPDSDEYMDYIDIGSVQEVLN